MVRITWTATDNGAQPTTVYRIYRSVAGGAFSLFTTVGAAATSYDDVNLASGTSYAYKVAAVNCPQLPAQASAPPAGEPAYVGGESLRSAAVSVTPDFNPMAPTSFAVGEPTATTLTLTWTAASADCPAATCTPAGTGASGVQGYAMYRGASGAETFVANLPSSSACSTTPCTYTDIDLTLGATYCYYLKAYDGYASGPNTSPATSESCGVPATAPAAVTDTFVVDEDILFSSSACAAGMPAATGGPYKGVLCNDQDMANDAIEGILITSPAQTSPGGSFAWDADNKGGFTYRAKTDYCGGTGDSFQYQLKDVTTNTLLNTVTVQLNIACTPVAVADLFAATINTEFSSPPCPANTPSATGGTYKGVLCNDQDTANHAILALLVSSPVNTSPGGSFAWNADNKGGFTYQAATDYCGVAGDSFQYRLKDVTANAFLNTVTVQIDISCTPNLPPVAACSIVTAAPYWPDEVVAFSSTGSSDSDGTITAWAWTFTGGSSPDTTIASPTASWSSSGPFAVTLTVTDDDDAPSAPASCGITITNTAPTGNPNEYVAIKDGLLDTLNQGRPSVLANDVDTEGNLNAVQFPLCAPLPAGTGTIDDFTYVGPQAGHFVYTPPAGFVGDTSFGYKPKDALGLVGASCVTVNIHVQVNRSPVSAFSADRSTTRVGEPVVFGDASSDPDEGDAVVAWAWSFGDGGSGTTSSPIHIFGTTGSFQACLTATDTWGKIGPKACRTITVIAATAGTSAPPAPPSQPPSDPADPDASKPPLGVDAGADQTVTESAITKLQATVTGGSQTVAWVQTYGPRVDLTQTGTSASFVAPALTGSRIVLYFELHAQDGERVGADGVMIEVESNEPTPAAQVAGDATVAPGAVAMLDGTSSSGGNGNSLTYKWTQWEGPAVTLVGADTPMATFTAPDEAATLRFALEVSDGHSSSLAIQTIVVDASAALGGEPEPLPSASVPTVDPDGSPATATQAPSGSNVAAIAAAAVVALLGVGGAFIGLRHLRARPERT